MAIGDIKAGRAYVEVGTDDKQLNAGLAAAQSKVTGFGNGLKDISFGMAALGAAAVAAGYKVAQFLVKNLTAAVDRASELVDTADRLGVGLESLQNLRFIGGRVGVEAEQISKALGFMQKNLGNGAIREELASIGLDLQKISRLGADEAFMEIADALRLVSNENDRAALTTKLFGRGGLELNNILKLGSEQMRQMAAEGKALGSVMSDDVARGLENAGDAMGDAATAWNNFWNNSGIQDWLVAVADITSETMTLGEAQTQTINGTRLALDRANADIRQAQKDRENAIKVEQAQAAAKAKAAAQERAEALAKEDALRQEEYMLAMQEREAKLAEEKAKQAAILQAKEEERKRIHEDIMRRGRSLFESTRTPEEQARMDAADAKALYSAGAIDLVTLARRMQQIADSLPKIQAASGVGSSAGTFNPFAARGLSDNERLTKAAEQTEKNTRKIADKMAQGLVFH